MVNKLKNINHEKFIVFLLLVLFIITEIIDLALDKSLGDSILHSILQLFVFLFLFIFTYRLFIKYTDIKTKKLIPEELMEILKIIKKEKNKGVLINQRKMREALGITKPTLKKRIDILLELHYIALEESGNHRNFILTSLGDSIFH